MNYNIFIIQDILFYYGEENSSIDLKPIEKIFENVQDIDKVYKFIT